MNDHIESRWGFLRQAGDLFRPRIVLFAALLTWYLYTVLNVRLVFEAHDELFLWSLRFFTDFIGQPGTLLKWVDSLLVQWCYFGWPGAMALGVVAWGLLVSTVYFMNATARAEVGGTWVIPAIGLVLLYGDYFSSKSMVVGLALAMLAACAWAGIWARRWWLRLGLFVLFSVVLYYAAGTAYYCFLGCCVAYEGPAEKRRWSAAAMLVAGAGVKFGLDAMLLHLDLGSRNFHVPSLDVFRQVPLSRGMVFLMGYLPACAILVAFRREIASVFMVLQQRVRKPAGEKTLAKPNRAQKQKKKAPNSKPDLTSLGIPNLCRWVAGTLLLLALPAVAGWYAFDRKTKAFLEIDYCVERQLWKDLLAKARQLRYYSRFTNHDVNLALYHTGRLPYEMFSYPQQFGILLDHKQFSATAISMLRKPCDLLLELGRVNEAECVVLEMLEMCPTGRTLKRLATVTMIKQQPAAARSFLNVLRDDLVLGRWAEQRLRTLALDPNLANEEDIQRVRRLMVSEDDLNLTCRTAVDGGVTLNYPRMLLDLLKQNHQNRMAFEYLMAIHLQACDLAAAVDLFAFLDHISYPALPPHFEEAALIYGADHPRDLVASAEGVFFRGRRISEPTLRKYRRLREILDSGGGSIQGAVPALSREFGDSYFAYYLTHAGRRHESP